MKDPARTPILVVDDERENLNLLERILGREYAVWKAPNAAAALRILEARDIHMILTDQRMPGIPGVELLDRSRSLRPDAVRILITAYPDVTVAVDAINRGQVKRYVAKPFDPAELRVIVRQELEVRAMAQSNRRLAEELAAKVEELQKLDRMKDHFLANVSHELKTPLVSALGYVELLLDGGMGSLEDRQTKGLRVAQRNLERLLGLIEDLLVLAKLKFRPERVERKKFPLGDLVREEVESLRARSRKETLDVTIEIPRRLPLVEGDERAIRSVFTNVLSNAEKFSPPQARIAIRARRATRTRCEVEVEDNGIGTAELKREDFPFFRSSDDAVSKKYGGLGIGLALARDILASHGCAIRLGPASRRGARVVFDLPLAGAGTRTGRAL